MMMRFLLGLIVVDPLAIQRVSVPLLMNPSNANNWDATIALLNLRSFVNSTLEEAKQHVGFVYHNNQPWTWAPSGPGEWLQIQGPGLVVLDGKPGEPGTVYARKTQGRFGYVIFKDVHVVYRGGPVTLINVFFDNCTFDVQSNGNGALLAKAIFSAPITDFQIE